MANLKPPPGGFQQGGWYEGKQYWNGTFSEPGQINVQSNQPGAGQMVSPEVNAQSAGQQGVSPAQLESYLAKQRALTPTTTTPAPSGGGGVATSGGGTMPVTPSINLPDLYKSLTKDSGIEGIQADLSVKEKQYNDAVSKINDNPFLSEASRVGRQQKLTTDYQNSIKSLQNDVTIKKADIETQLNLKSKQFDIESQQAKDALSQFNTLLDMGSLNNAGGDEIAAITRTTGLSSSMIQSAINTSKAKNVKTETIKFDDGTNQGFAIINSDTGDIISKQTVAESKPTSADTKIDIGSSYSDYLSNKTVTINGRTGPVQQLMSPEDFYKYMSQQFPGQISSIPKPAEIRKITGQQ